jgi:cobalt/nickel transport system permease protein
MHMANELLSVPVAAGTLAIAGGCLGFICKKAKQLIDSDKIALMGIMGAFVFAGQMVNFQLPAMPGTSGHMVGAVLLAIILGPHAGAIVMSSVVIIQCLIFQDGGLLALGCNIINMGLVPCYLGYFIYKRITSGPFNGLRVYAAVMLASIATMEVSAFLVVVQVAFSGVLLVPLGTFLTTMLSVHILVGFFEGFITVAVLGYIQQVRPDIVFGALAGKVRLSKKAVLATLAVFAVITAGGISLLACGFPDGLEWSYAERPDQPDFEPIVSNNDSVITRVDELHSKYAPLPDYSIRTSEGANAAAAWTSFAGVIGSAATMIFIYLTARLVRKKQSAKT